MPIGIGKPVRLANALYRLAEADRNLRLRIFTGLTLVRPRYRTHLERRFVAPLLDRLFGSYPEWPTSRRCARIGCRPTSRSPNSSCRPARADRQRPCSRAIPASTTRRSRATCSAWGPMSSAQLVAPHPRGEAHISLSSNTDVTLDMALRRGAARRRASRSALAGRAQRQPAVHARRGRVRRSEVDVLLDRPGRTTTCSRRPRSPYRSRTTPWPSMRPR